MTGRHEESASWRTGAHRCFPRTGVAGRAPALTSHTRVSFLACRPDARAARAGDAARRRRAPGRAAGLQLRRRRRPRRAGPCARLRRAERHPHLHRLRPATRHPRRGRPVRRRGAVPVRRDQDHHPRAGRRPMPRRRPAGGATFAERVSDVVLPGYSAFSLADARAAGQRLLQDGPVRIKLASGIGGSGQSVAQDAAQLDAQLAALDAAEVARHGVVLERNLDDARTYSVGLLRVGGLRGELLRHAAHHAQPARRRGVRRLDAHRRARRLRRAGARCRRRRGRAPRDRAGAHLPRGRAGVLRRHVRVALQLRRRRKAATRAAGCCAGVLEQSWRIGGASGAEVAALQALCDDPSLEIGARVDHRGARPARRRARRARRVYFRGVDEHVGPITKYAQVHAHADTRTEDRHPRSTPSPIEGTLVTPGIADPRRAVRARLGRQPAAVPRAGARDRGARLRVPHLRPERPCRHAAAARDRVAREQSARRARRLRRAGRAIRMSIRSAIAVVGSSYGGYLAAILTTLRPVKWLALRVPALYIDTGWELPKLQLHKDQDLRAYRRSFVPAEANRALRACAEFKGDVLIVESEHDDIIPPAVITSYREACVQGALAHLSLHRRRRPRPDRRREPARVHRAADAVAGRDAAQCAPRAATVPRRRPRRRCRRRQRRRPPSRSPKRRRALREAQSARHVMCPPLMPLPSCAAWTPCTSHRVATGRAMAAAAQPPPHRRQAAVPALR